MKNRIDEGSLNVQRVDFDGVERTGLRVSKSPDSSPDVFTPLEESKLSAATLRCTSNMFNKQGIPCQLRCTRCRSQRIEAYDK